MVLALVPKPHAPLRAAALMTEAPWSYDSMLTPARLEPQCLRQRWVSQWGQ